jgi:hypothetical protein
MLSGALKDLEFTARPFQATAVSSEQSPQVCNREYDISAVGLARSEWWRIPLQSYQLRTSITTQCPLLPCLAADGRGIARIQYAEVPRLVSLVGVTND